MTSAFEHTVAALRRRGFWPVLAIALAVFSWTAAGAAAFPHNGPRSQPAGVVSYVQQKPQAVRRYWTRRRMREAKPVPVPKLSRRAAARISTVGEPSGGVEKLIPPSSPIRLNSPLTDFRIEESTAYPNRVNGKLYMTNEVGTNFACSASVVVSPGKSLIFTAGHCAYDEGEWDHNFLFKPAFNNGVSPYGNWVAARIRAPTAWVSSGGTNWTYDVAVLTLYPNSEGTRIQSDVGAWGVLFNGSANRYHEVIGYPGTPEPYNGQEMIGCDTSFAGWQSAYTTATNGSFPVAPCNQGHGSSGGPFVTEEGSVQAVMSHAVCKESEPTNCGEEAYGTYFGTAAENLYNAAENEAPTLPTPAPTPAPPPPPPTEAQSPTMTSTEAKALGRRGLTEDFRAKFKHRHEYRVSCKRIETAKQRCSVSWYDGPNDYYGSITVYYLRENGELLWNDRYTINSVNDHCYYHTRYWRSCRVHTRRR